VALAAGQLPGLLANLASSTHCGEHDLADPITMLIATGLRRSALLGLRWGDVDTAAATVTVSGKLVRVSGEGLKSIPAAKSDAGLRTLALPRFALDMLAKRRLFA
jgi:integrase